MVQLASLFIRNGAILNERKDQYSEIMSRQIVVFSPATTISHRLRGPLDVRFDRLDQCGPLVQTPIFLI